MRNRSGVRFAPRLLAALTLILVGAGSPARGTAVLELYGTFHALGITVTIDPDDDPDGDAATVVTYRVAGEGLFREGLPLDRVDDLRFVGSLFWLEPGGGYEVRVTFDDPDGALHGSAVEGTTSTRAEIVIPPPTASYHVSPSGSGTECSATNPCALAYAAEQAETGEEIVFHGGVYYEGGFDLPRSGTEAAPIVLRGAEGETAILDGSDSATFTWTALGAGIYRTTIHVPAPHVVLADGLRLFPYTSLTDLRDLIWDATPGFFADGTDLYVHLAGDADPAGVAIVVSRHNYAFLVMQDFVYFLDLTFRHYGQGDWSKCIYLFGASDNLVRGCTFTSNDLGVGIKYDSNRNVIEESEFSDTIYDWPWDGVKDVGGLEDGGVLFYAPATGRGNIIRRNVFHDDFDGFGSCPLVAEGGTNETDVYENLVYNMGDDGMETDGRCSNVRIWGNVFHDVLMGISMAPVFEGPVFAIRNLIYRSGVGNNVYSGSPFKFNSGYDESGEMFLFHNTCDAVLPGNNGLYIKAPGSWDRIIARNNIWAGTDYAIDNYNTSQPVDLDYDDLWNGEVGDLVRWDNTSYATLAAFTGATGQEPNGWSVVPGFFDPIGGDYSLDSTSDLIDVAVVIPGINDDYAGAAPDIGAFERRPDGSGIDGGPVRTGLDLACSPNPLRTVTQIRYRLPGAAFVDLAIFDPAGRRLATLRSGAESAGDHAVAWDGKGEGATHLSRGVYFLRLRAGGAVRTATVVLLESRRERQVR